MDSSRIGWLKNLAGAAATLVLVATQALGATIDLTCKLDSGTGYGGGHVILDETAKTAVFGNDPVSPAQFSKMFVSWGKVEVTDAGVQFNKFYNLNRATGALTTSGTSKGENSPQWTAFKGSYQCSAAQK